MTSTPEFEHCGPDAAHRYVAGKLSAAEAADFELHLLECGQCRLDVRDGAAIAAGLRRTPAIARTVPKRRTVAWAAAAGAIAAAVVLTVFVPRGDVAKRLARLDDPPAFEALPVRASVNATDRIVDSAMAAYAVRDYATARRLLERAEAAAASDGTAFYLGAASLADGAPDAAVGPLSRVVGEPGSPYATTARVLLAKALVGIGRADSAAALLDGDRDPAARAFRDSVLAIVRR